MYMYVKQSKANGGTQDRQLISKKKAELPWAGLEPAISGFHDQRSNPLSHQGSSAGREYNATKPD